MKNPVAAKNLRARDTDRTDVCALLDAALADGQLSAAEHENRTATAMRAETFGALDRLVDDLQVPADLAATPVARGIPRAPRRWWIPVGAVAGAALLGALAGLIGRTAGDVVAGESVPDLTTGTGFAYFLAAYQAEFGSMVADDATVYPDSVRVSRDSGQPGKADRWGYRGGKFETWGPQDRRPPGTPSFDLAEVDVERFARIVAGAPETVRIPDGRVTLVTIRFSSGQKDPWPEIGIHVKNEAEQTGHFTIALDGEPLAVHPAR
ncbi:DUF1707 domain-containing protein [Nocardia sp. NPDC058176]|uniref:DUF1707 SHOCT-like domain-containing protein n=1 Tax=Nocardia sp. NPDC058176 TaxID=3346368 RepID=UPI0036DAF342